MIINMKTKLKKIFLGLILWIGLLGNIFTLNIVSANGQNFQDAMQKSVKAINDDWHLDAPIVDWTTWDKAKALVQKIVDVFFSVMVVVWVLVAMIGFYTILTSNDEAKIKTWINTLIYGVIWILLMYSAKYLTGVIFEKMFFWWEWHALSTVELIKNLYGDMVYPFLKIAIYLCLGILVIIMITRVFTYITSQDEWTKKKSLWVIAWTTVGMLLITWAKQIVEAVYWKQGEQQGEVLYEGSRLSEIGSVIFDPADIPIIYNVINRALWLIAFVLLAMIIIQTYKLLTKPDDAATFTSLKKTIIYALAWILLIGAAYVLANLFIIS